MDDLLRSDFLRGTGLRALAVRAAVDRLRGTQQKHDCPYTMGEVLALVRAGRKRSNST
jgi:hypothetical protein